jgi:prepilin-type N-terminal cleavage/methylation domain-containing protein
MKYLSNKRKAKKLSKGFTLIELLIVIGILSVITSIVVIVLNPGEILAQGRDAQRINDLNTLRIAMASYISLVPNLDLGACPVGGTCTFNPGAGKGPFTNNTCGAINSSNNITGTGWVSVNFTDISGPMPIPALPIDPVNSDSYFYAYGCQETPRYVFELNARLESQKNRGNMAFDGGDKNCLCGGATCTLANIQYMTPAESLSNNCFYEVGSAAQLNL